MAADLVASRCLSSPWSPRAPPASTGSGGQRRAKQAKRKFLGRPQLPGYKDKQTGRNLLISDLQALSAPALRRGAAIPSQLGISIPTRQTTLRQARIVPRKSYYVVELVYEREPVLAPVTPALHASVDLGVNNLATIASDKAGFVPRIVNGRPVKSINPFYNNRRALLQGRLGHPGTKTQMEQLTAHRTRQIDHYLHTARRRIIELLVAEGIGTRVIGTLVIGTNPLWKQEANLGRRGNQNVVSIPLNADGNGAYNILRKALPDAVGKGIAGAAVHPVRLPVRTKRAA